MDDAPKKDNKDNRELLAALSGLSQLGFTMAACVFVGVFSGMYLDRHLGTMPWMLVLCSLSGAVAAFKALFDLTKKK